MTKRTRLLAVLLLIAGTAVLLMAVVPVQWTASTDNFTQLLSNDSEAYLIVRSSRLGYRRNMLRFVVDVISSRLGTVPTDVRQDLVVVRVTSNGLEQRTFSGVQMSRVGIVAGRAYTEINGKLMRFSAANLEPASLEEQRQVQAAGGLLSTGDWFSRSGLLNGDPGESKLDFMVAGQSWTLIAHNNRTSEGWTAIDLQKGGDTPERVWHVNVRPQYTTKSDYGAFLADGGAS